MIPKKIVDKLKEAKISEDYSFNWTNFKFCHCTIKAISVCDEIPKEIDLWAENSEKIISNQKPFRVSIEDISAFPKTIFTKVNSQELIKLHERLFKILPSSHIQFEGKNYVPHVSLLNLKKDVKKVISQKENFGKFEVKEIQLMVWDLNDFNNSKVYRNYLLSSNK